MLTHTQGTPVPTTTRKPLFRPLQPTGRLYYIGTNCGLGTTRAKAYFLVEDEDGAQCRLAIEEAVAQLDRFSEKARHYIAIDLDAQAKYPGQEEA